jgi:hypothetical protein
MCKTRYWDIIFQRIDNMTAKYAKTSVSTWVKKYTLRYNHIRILGSCYAYLTFL